MSIIIKLIARSRSSEIEPMLATYDQCSLPERKPLRGFVYLRLDISIKSGVSYFTVIYNSHLLFLFKLSLAAIYTSVENLVR